MNGNIIIVEVPATRASRAFVIAEAKAAAREARKHTFLKLHSGRTAPNGLEFFHWGPDGELLDYDATGMCTDIPSFQEVLRRDTQAAYEAAERRLDR